MRLPGNRGIARDGGSRARLGCWGLRCQVFPSTSTHGTGRMRKRLFSWPANHWSDGRTEARTNKQSHPPTNALHCRPPLMLAMTPYVPLLFTPGPLLFDLPNLWKSEPLQYLARHIGGDISINSAKNKSRVRVLACCAGLVHQSQNPRALHGGALHTRPSTHKL